MRLIDADEVRNHKYVAMGGDLTLYKEGWNDAIDTIMDETPTVDAEPVVRCKECKWFHVNKTAIWCEKERGLNYPQYDSFCSWGERREDETD